MVSIIDPALSESLLLANCITTDRTYLLAEKGLSPNKFVVYGDVLEFILDYNKKYSKNPDIDTILTVFPTFPENKNDSCDFDFLLDVAVDNGKGKMMKEIIDRAITLNHENPDKAIEFAMSEMSNIKSEVKVSASYFDGDQEGRVDRYLKRKRRIEKGFRIGLPTGIPQLDKDLMGFVPGDFVILAGPPGVGKCLSGDTKIVDAKTGKVVRIDEINDSNSVFVLDDSTLKMTTYDRPKLIKQGKKEVYIITTKTGRSSKATLNHPFLTINGWKKLSDINVGDRIAVPNEVPVFGNYDIDDWKVKFLGYMIGDGHVCMSPQFSNTDDNVMNDFVRCANNFGDKISVHPGKAYITRKGGHAGIGHSESGNWFLDIGLIDENNGWMLSKDKYLPDFVFEMPKDKICMLLAAMWDTDGEVNSGKIGYATISERLGDQVAHLLLRLGIITNRGYTKSAKQIIKFYDLIGKNMIGYKRAKLEEMVNQKKSIKSNEMIDLFPKEMWNIVLDERPQYFIDRSRHSKEYCTGNWLRGRGISKSMVSKFAESYNSDILRKYAHSDIIWDSIISVEYSGIEETYDLSLDKYHNFVANDIFVHNSWLLMKMCSLSYLTGVKVLYISPEMCEDDVTLRLHSIIGRSYGSSFSNEALMTGSLIGSGYEEYVNFLKDKLSTRNDWIIIDDIEGGAFTVSKLETLIKTYNPTIIAVDSIILMTASDGSPAIAWQSLIDVAYGLKMLATRTKTVVLATAPTTADTFESTDPATISELGLSKNMSFAIDIGISVSKAHNPNARFVSVFKKRKGRGTFEKQEIQFMPDIGIIGG